MMPNDPVKLKFRGMRKEITEILGELNCRKCANRCYELEGDFDECVEEVADKIMKQIFAVD